jgi:hypothetical protein
MNYKRTISIVSICLVAGLFGFAAIVSRAARSGSDSKYPSYTNIEDLAADTDTIIEGIVEAGETSFVDNGGDESFEGYKLRVIPVKVLKSIRGNPAGKAEVKVFQEANADSESIPLKEGDHVLMFLNSFRVGDRPDFDKTFGVDMVFSPMGVNASIFDISGSDLIPRDGTLDRIGAKSTTAHRFNVSEVIRIVSGIPARKRSDGLLQAQRPSGTRRTVPERKFDFDSFTSVESVLDKADTVVVGQIGKTVSRQIDHGGFAETPDIGNPVILQQIVVKEVLRDSSVKPGSILTHISFDPDRIKIDDQKPLRDGELVVVFSERIVKSDMPGIQGFDLIYGRIGADSSIFDLDANTETITPRDSNIGVLRADEVGKKSASAEFSLASIRELAILKPTRSTAIPK